MYTILELVVNNHPGVMSHVTGLFSRRAYNLEGIMCGHIEDGRTSVMYLLVQNNNRQQQVIRQLEKLHDVRLLTIRNDMDPALFFNLKERFAPNFSYL